jgi:hypothetical protein
MSINLFDDGNVRLLIVLDGEKEQQPRPRGPDVPAG